MEEAESNRVHPLQILPAFHSCRRPSFLKTGERSCQNVPLRISILRARTFSAFLAGGCSYFTPAVGKCGVDCFRETSVVRRWDVLLRALVTWVIRARLCLALLRELVRRSERPLSGFGPRESFGPTCGEQRGGFYRTPDWFGRENKGFCHLGGTITTGVLGQWFNMWDKTKRNTNLCRPSPIGEGRRRLVFPAFPYGVWRYFSLPGR